MRSVYNVRRAKKNERGAIETKKPRDDPPRGRPQLNYLTWRVFKRAGEFAFSSLAIDPPANVSFIFTHRKLQVTSRYRMTENIDYGLSADVWYLPETKIEKGELNNEYNEILTLDFSRKATM